MFFVTEIGPWKERFMGARLSGLYIFSFFLPVFISWNERLLLNLAKILLVANVIVGLNALRQYLYPFDVEVTHAMNSGGAALFMGDLFQGEKDSFRIFSTMLTSVHLVTFEILCFLLSFGLFYIGGVKTPLVCTNIFLSLVVILLCFSRTAWVSFLISFFPMIFFAFKASSFRAKYLMIATLITSSFLVIYMFNHNQLFGSRIMTLVNIFDGEMVSSLGSRLLLWETAMDTISKNPFGLGLGSGGWNLHYLMGAGSDSNYMKFFIELGWAGGVLSILLLSIVFLKFLSTLRYIFHSNETGITPAFVVILFGFYLSVLVAMVTNQVLEAYPVNILFWFMIGLFASLRGSLRPIS